MNQNKRLSLFLIFGRFRQYGLWERYADYILMETWFTRSGLVTLQKTGSLLKLPGSIFSIISFVG